MADEINTAIDGAVNTPLERAARAAADQHGEDWDDLPDINPIQNGDLDRQYFRDQARAVIEAIREPMREWLDHQIEHGHAPDGAHVEMTQEYALGRDSAFRSSRAMIDALLAEGGK